MTANIDGVEKQQPLQGRARAVGAPRHVMWAGRQMPGRPIDLTILFSRVLQLIGGIIVMGLGLFLFFRIFTKALSLGQSIRPVTDLKVFMILALPGLIIGIGSYLQVIRRTEWGVIAVLMGGIGNVILVVLNVGLAYVLVQDPWGRNAIVADLVATFITALLAICNLLLPSKARPLNMAR